MVELGYTGIDDADDTPLRHSMDQATTSLGHVIAGRQTNILEVLTMELDAEYQEPSHICTPVEQATQSRDQTVVCHQHWHTTVAIPFHPAGALLQQQLRLHVRIELDQHK